jgi:hypothetical protein
MWTWKFYIKGTNVCVLEMQTSGAMDVFALHDIITRLENKYSNSIVYEYQAN